MSNFNPNKCYIEQPDKANIASDLTNINYYFPLILSFLYMIVLLWFLFAPGFSFSNTVGGNGIRLLLLYSLGIPNIKIFFNSLFAKKLKLDLLNGVIYVNNKPLAIERATNITVTEICPYHYSWRYGQTPAFNLSFYQKSVITITTDFGNISFYVCTKKAVDMLTKFFEKFSKDYDIVYDERRLFFTFY